QPDGGVEGEAPERLVELLQLQGALRITLDDSPPRIQLLLLQHAAFLRASRGHLDHLVRELFPLRLLLQTNLQRSLTLLLQALLQLTVEEKSREREEATIATKQHTVASEVTRVAMCAMQPLCFRPPTIAMSCANPSISFSTHAGMRFPADSLLFFSRREVGA